MRENLQAYFELKHRRPDLFKDSEIIPIEYDIEKLEDFEVKNNRRLGVVYSSKYNTLLVDLIKGDTGYYAYERVVPTSIGTPIVVIARFNGKFVLLKQYRHAIRNYQIACVRGFGDNTAIDGISNVTKEVLEELGSSLINIELLGSIAADSGLTSAIAEVYLCDITEPTCKNVEGIEDVLIYSESQLRDLVKTNQIFDSFTLSAFMLYFSKLEDEML